MFTRRSTGKHFPPSRYSAKSGVNCLPMQISVEIYYMGKQLTLAENPLGGFPSAPRLKFPSFLVLIFLDSWIMDYGFLWGVVVHPHRNPLPQNPNNTGLSPTFVKKNRYS